MRSLKAIFAGSVFIVVAILFIQLAYIFMAVGYHSLAKDYAFLNEISDVFKYLIGLPAVMLVMFYGGYITAAIANIKILLHCFIVGLITSGGMLLMALENTELTIMGGLVFLLALAITTAGGVYWQRDNQPADTA